MAGSDDAISHDGFVVKDLNGYEQEYELAILDTKPTQTSICIYVTYPEARDQNGNLSCWWCHDVYLRRYEIGSKTGLAEDWASVTHVA
jgi:hypothetical protein